MKTQSRRYFESSEDAIVSLLIFSVLKCNTVGLVVKQFRLGKTQTGMPS